jgi:hypothetical protein
LLRPCINCTWVCYNYYYNTPLTLEIIRSATVNEWLLLNANASNISAISWRKQVDIQWDDDEVHFVLDQHAELDFYKVKGVL